MGRSASPRRPSGRKFGPAVTGALQSTLGNLPELFIVLFALSAGELVVAQFSILGSLFANALLVLGLAIVVGVDAGSPTARCASAPRSRTTPRRSSLLARVPDRDPRALRPGRRPREPPPGRDLGRRGDLPADRLRRLARSATCAPTRRRQLAHVEQAHADASRSASRSGSLGGAGRLGGARLGVVRRRARPGGRGDRHLEGVHGPRDRRDRGERGRERRRASSSPRRGRTTSRSRS